MLEKCNFGDQPYLIVEGEKISKVKNTDVLFLTLTGFDMLLNLFYAFNIRLPEIRAFKDVNSEINFQYYYQYWKTNPIYCF